MRASSFCYLGLLSIIPISAVLLPIITATPGPYAEDIPVVIDETWIDEEIEVDMNTTDSTSTHIDE